jgi:two-component system, LuxR family, response regulator FixJ
MMLHRQCSKLDINGETSELLPLAERGAQLLSDCAIDANREETIHIVDDDADTRQIIVGMIAEVGVRAETYASAADFLATYVSGSPGCLVTDLRMPEIDGLSLVRRLKQTAESLPVIVVTGSGDIRSAVEAMHLSAVDVLLKPFERLILCDRIRHSLALDATRRRLIERRTTARSLLSRLTDRELEVLELIVDGLSNRQIALRTRASERTIEAHRGRIAKKLLARNDFEIARVTLNGLGEEPDIQKPDWITVGVIRRETRRSPGAIGGRDRSARRPR